MPRVKPTKTQRKPKKAQAPTTPTFEIVEGPGRPPIVLTPDQEKQLEQLAAIDCTNKEIAAVMDIHVDTLRDNFSTLIEKGRNKGKASLRRAQFKNAVEKDNATMQIWLGKVKLGQAETVSVPADEKGKTRAPQYFRIGGQLLEI